MSRPTAIVIGVGAEHGLGAALCRRFAAEGHHVLVAGRTPHRIEQVVRAIAEAGGSAEAVPTDTTREDEVGTLFDRAMSQGGGNAPLDLVVFNAGNNQRIDFRETTAAEFEAFWRVGCFGGFLVGREAARRLAPLGRGTVIRPSRSSGRMLRPSVVRSITMSWASALMVSGPCRRNFARIENWVDRRPVGARNRS